MNKIIKINCCYVINGRRCHYSSGVQTYALQKKCSERDDLQGEKFDPEAISVSSIRLNMLLD